MIFKDNCKDNPLIFKIHDYFLYKVKILKEVIIIVYFPTIKVKSVLVLIVKGYKACYL
jgi:hypothetical protein